MKRRMLIVLASLVICALLAAPALAMAPVREALVTVQDVVDPFATCPGGVTVSALSNASGPITTYFNAAGVPVRTMANVWLDVVFSGGGRTYSAGGRQVWANDIQANVLKQVGTQYHLAVPGLGMAAVDAGLVLKDNGYVVTVKGIHVDDMDLGRFCAAFE